MTYQEWCELVLMTLAGESSKSREVNERGIDDSRLEKIIWGARFDEISKRLKMDRLHVTDDVFRDLRRLGLIEMDRGSPFAKLTLNGKRAATGLFILWEHCCSTHINSDLEHPLSILNRLGVVENDNFGRVVDVHLREIQEELNSNNGNLTERDVELLIRELGRDGLAFFEDGDYLEEIQPTYKGLTFELRMSDVRGMREMAQLLNEWETTSVEFKRELKLDTASEKAEFIKDIVGLANTQASGVRRLIVGFDDKTREFHASPGEKITQNRLEQILFQYTEPHIQIKYSSPLYKSSKIGIIEICRNAADLPYTVRESYGPKEQGQKRIEKGQIFVRHGSQTEEPTELERSALLNEGQRARTFGR
jgi:schlafen family protein